MTGPGSARWPCPATVRGSHRRGQPRLSESVVLRGTSAGTLARPAAVDEGEQRPGGHRSGALPAQPADADAGSRRGVRRLERELVEPGRDEPGSQLRREVRLPAVPGPDHGGSLPAKNGRSRGRATDVGVTDVPENAAEQQDVRRQRIRVSRRTAGIRLAY